MQIVQLSGGKILSREPKSSDQPSCLYPFHAQRNVNFPAYNRFIVYSPCAQQIPTFRGTNDIVKFIPASWLLDCLSHFELLNVPNITLH